MKNENVLEDHDLEWKRTRVRPDSSEGRSIDIYDAKGKILFISIPLDTQQIGFKVKTTGGSGVG